VVILAMDGFWRHGGTAETLMPALLAKQAKNMARTWPDWRTRSEDQAIEHDRSGETLPAVTPTPEPAAWDDRDDDLTPMIDAAHPCLTRNFSTYERAQQLVTNRHSKGALVALVNYLLTQSAQPHDRTALDAAIRAAKVEAWKEALTAIRGVKRWQPRTHGPYGMNQEDNGKHVKFADAENAILALIGEGA
jgi:Protein of unknown function (DUF550)